MNFLVILYLLVIAPKLFWDRIRKGKRHPGFLQRLGFYIPKTDQPVIWIHAVSVGEVKAAQPLFRELRKREEGTFFLITTTTATGQAEAKRSLPEADAIAYLPIDLTWVVRRWVNALKPKTFILVESDFWYNLLKVLKKHGTQIVLVSGKISQRSARRFQKFPFFSKKLFSHFDHLCVQNETHFQRFLPLVPDPGRLQITGNLKFDLQSRPIDQTLDLPHPAVLTISCTHPFEEELLLDALRGGDWFILLAPRHPERFAEVAQLLSRKKLSFSRWTQREHPGPILLVDVMGQLPVCYSHSRLAILGGSYVDHIGGHNVLEPCLYGTPVIFGPYTQAQTELTSRVLEAGAGLRVPLDQLRQAVTAFFSNPSREQAMKQAAHQLIQASRGATSRTLNMLSKT